MPHARASAAPRPWWLLSCLALLIAACSGGGGSKGGEARGNGSEPPHLRVTDAGLFERNGGHDRQILSLKEGTYITGVALAPDTKRLAYVFQPEATSSPGGEVDFGADLYTINRDGSGRKEVVHHSRNGEFLAAPLWLADGNTLLFVVRGRDKEGLPDFRLESLDLRNGQRKRVIEDVVDAGISDDGKTLAYVNFDPLSSDGESLRLVEIGSSSDRVLVPGDSGLVLLGSPSFSPDGSRIAFAASSLFMRAPSGSSPRALMAAHPTLQDVWMVNRDGTNLKRIAEIVENQPSVDWSSDGAYVYALGATAFWRIDAATGAVSEVGTGVPNGVMELLPQP